MLLSLVAGAAAADAPAWFVRETLTVAGFPTGALSESRLQVRAPLYRSDSIVFQDTYAGGGLRLDVSPAFVNPGVILSLAPIDVFDVDLSAELLGYLPGPFGLLPYDTLGSKLEDVRDSRDDHFAALGWALDANPTLKLKVGPIIAVDAVAISWLHVTRPDGEDAPYVYEPCRDVLVAWDELYVEHQPIVLYEALPGGDRPLLYTGVTWRDKIATVSTDRSATLGAVVVARPGTRPVIPTFVGMASVYLIDAERVGWPFLALQAMWELEPPLKRGRP